MPQDSTLSSKDAKKRKQISSIKVAAFISQGGPLLLLFFFSFFLFANFLHTVNWQWQKAKHPIVLLLTKLPTSDSWHGGGGKIWRFQITLLFFCLFFLFCFLNAVIKAGGDISMLLIKGNQLVWKSKGKKCLKDHPPTQMQSQVVSLEWYLSYVEQTKLYSCTTWIFGLMRNESDRFVVSGGAEMRPLSTGERGKAWRFCGSGKMRSVLLIFKYFQAVI